jgi:hypothetical protein
MELIVADLDVDRIYWGMTSKASEDLAAGDVVFKAEAIPMEQRVANVTYLAGECDLAEGRYRWDPPTTQFVPLGRFAHTRERAAPIPERALFELVSAWPAELGPLPDYTKRWAEYYAQTIDSL